MRSRLFSGLPIALPTYTPTLARISNGETELIICKTVFSVFAAYSAMVFFSSLASRFFPFNIPKGSRSESAASLSKTISPFSTLCSTPMFSKIVFSGARGKVNFLNSNHCISSFPFEM